MLKRFLKIFGGNTGDPETLEGGYLESALEAVEPRVRAALEDCQAHDPLLLVAVEVLREASEQRWQEDELECPVADGQSPNQEKPPPPPDSVTSVDTLDVTEEVKKARAVYTKNTPLPGEQEAVEAEDDEAEEGAETSAAEPPPMGEEPAAGQGGAPTGGGLSIDSNVEVGPDGLEEGSVSEEGGIRLDSEPVLQVARVFLGVLAENDRLPAELQMQPDDIDRARELLLAYFLEDHGVDAKAHELLQVVERKFNEGMFSQARILLQLFEADDATLVENDRNLFYEEMILRFGVQRRHELRQDVTDAYAAQFEALSKGQQELDDFFRWVAESVYVSLNVLGRGPAEVEDWRGLAGLSNRKDVEEYFLEVVPPRRWRLPGQFGASLGKLLEEQFSPETLRSYVTDQIKTCYFILRAVGDTGMEPFLDVFFDWTEEAFDVDATGLMPRLYNETTANERLIEDIFDDLYDEHFREPVEACLESWGDEEIEEAAGEVIEWLGELEPNDVPPGHYNLGGFVLDRLFGLEFHAVGFPFKLHRLT